MAEPRTISTAELREVMRTFCREQENSISSVQIYHLLGLELEQEKDSIRKRINDMTRTGELKKVKNGLFKYNFKFSVSTADYYRKVWRLIRAERGNFTYEALSQLTGVSYSQVQKYGVWLRKEGFIEKRGKDKTNIIIWGLTQKGDLHPETPFPPKCCKNPFEQENAAAAKIARLMLCKDPNSPGIARQVVEACNVLIERFSEKVT